jgi:hypothetical protein
MSATDNTTLSTTAEPGMATVPPAGSPITPTVFHDMLNVLDQLVSHTHIYYDDYGTACNCWNNSNCTRGIV